MTAVKSTEMASHGLVHSPLISSDANDVAVIERIGIEEILRIEPHEILKAQMSSRRDFR